MERVLANSFSGIHNSKIICSVGQSDIARRNFVEMEAEKQLFLAAETSQ
jgi:hypothetical protein